MPSFAQRLNFTKALISQLSHNLWHGQLDLRTTNLVYSTLLSLVPLLALSFSVLKAFGAHNLITPLLTNLLAPLGAQGNIVVESLVNMVNKVEVGVLGVTGLFVLIYTVITLMQKVEDAFNDTWYIKKKRSLDLLFRDYMSVLLLGPLILFAAVGISANLWNTMLLENIPNTAWVNSFLHFWLQYTPSLMLLLSFSLMYRFIPNTRVNWSAAFIAALISSSLWKLAGWGFTTFVVNLSAQAALYSVFAGLFFFILWLYIAWFIVLLGASIAYYLQHPGDVYTLNHQETANTSSQQLFILGIMHEIILGFHAGHTAPTLNQLSQRLNTPNTLLAPVIDLLIEEGILSPDHQTPSRYLLATSPEHITLTRLQHIAWQGTQAQRQQAQDILTHIQADTEWAKRKPDLKSLNWLTAKQQSGRY